VATAGNTRPGLFGISWTVSRVGEYSPAIGPAPAKIDPGSGLLAFHRSVIAYGVEAATGTAAFMLAALGLNVPAKPPLSFHATTLPLTATAMTRLNPALAVHRSALAVLTADESPAGVIPPAS